MSKIPKIGVADCSTTPETIADNGSLDSCHYIAILEINTFLVRLYNEEQQKIF